MKSRVIRALQLVFLIFFALPFEAEAIQNQPTKPAAQSSETRIIRDMAGREVEVKNRITKIATLGSVPMLNTFIECLGAGNEIFNHPSAFHNIYGRWRMHLKFAPHMKEGPIYETAGHELLAENLLANPPDLCVTNSKARLEMLEKLKVPTIFVDLSTTDKMLDSVRVLGKALNKQDAAEKYIEYFHSTMADLKRRGDAIPQKDRLRVLYSNPQSLRVPSEPVEKVMKLIGSESVTRKLAEQKIRTFDLEDVMRWDPQILFISNPRLKAELSGSPALKDVSGVRSGQMVVTPTVGHFYGSPNVELPIAGYWMLHNIYPKYFSREDLKEKMKEFYKNFFNYEMTDDDLNLILSDNPYQGEGPRYKSNEEMMSQHPISKKAS